MARFQKGKSGNPGGRPKVIGDVRELARQYAPLAITTLHEIAANAKAPAAARVLASNSLLDRGYGKPVQAIAGDPNSPPVQHAVAHSLDAKSAAILDKVIFGKGDAS